MKKVIKFSHDAKIYSIFATLLPKHRVSITINRVAKRCETITYFIIKINNVITVRNLK